MNPPALLDRLPPPLRKRPAVILLGAVLVLLVLSWLLRPRTSTASTAYHEVRQGDFTVSIVEGGNLAAVSEVSIRNEVEGTARIIFIVPEGSYVRKGQLLVELDSAQAQDQINQQTINVEKAQFALIQAQAQLDIQRSTTNSDIQTAVLRLSEAEIDLAKFLQGQQVVTLIEASNKLVASDAALAQSLDNYVNSSNLASRGYETKQNLERDRISLMNARNSLIISSNQLWMLKAFDLLKDSNKVASAVQLAKQELDRVVAQSERRIAQYEADLVTQSNTLALSVKKLERDKKNVDSCKIYAPQDGLVVYPVGENRFSQESLIEEGAVVRNRQELIKLPDTSRMKVTVKVHESHVNMVRPGLPAFVILDSMPDTRFSAVVEKVGLLPDTSSRWGNPNLKVYNTDVYVTDPLPDIKPGVSAKAEIIITNIADTLSVPIQAVTTLRGRQVVYLAGGSTPEPKPVEVGMYNTKFIQVLSGLRAGDRVLLAPPFDTQDRDIEGAVLADDEKSRVARSNRPPATASSAGRPGPRTETNGPAAGPRSRPNAEATAGPRGGGERALAGDDANGRPNRNGSAEARPGFNPQELLKQYDKDGDGQLNDEERDAMRQAMAARFGAGGPGAGGPGGPGGPGGGRAGFDREAMLKQYDKDGDGELNDEERDAMRQAMAARFGAGGQGGPGGGRGGFDREAMLKQYDKDGDGQLNDEERAAMRQSMGGGSRTNRGDRARGGGFGGGDGGAPGPEGAGGRRNSNRGEAGEGRSPSPTP